MPQINRSQLALFAPNVKFDLLDTYVESLNAAFARFGIDQSWRRIRYFMAQSYHETQGYTKFTEVMNYTTPERLATVFSTRFTTNRALVGTHAKDKSGKPYPQSLAWAADYTNNPERLANNVYAGRNGNGNEASGDGWRFRGRGGFHLTFKSNYAGYSQRIYGDDRIVQNPDLVAQPKDAFMSAGDYWNATQYVEKDAKGNVVKRWSFNELADKDQFTWMSIAIQGSDQTAQERLAVLRLANRTFTD